MSTIRPELPTPPARIARLPVDDRGYPVPFFVQWVKDGKPVPPGEGTPDHRIMDISKMPRAIKEHLCWICGERLGKYMTYSIGPMCAVNRTVSEPPSHLECARYSAQACPFLSRPHARYRKAGVPEDKQEPAGLLIDRNPGVSILWTTTEPVKARRIKKEVDGSLTIGGGILFEIPEPEAVEAWAEGRKATWDEVFHSITTGLPHLEAVAQTQGEYALSALKKQSEKATEHLRKMLEAA